MQGRDKKFFVKKILKKIGENSHLKVLLEIHQGKDKKNPLNSIRTQGIFKTQEKLFCIGAGREP